MVDIARLKWWAWMFSEDPRVALAYLIAPRGLKTMIGYGAERELAARAIQRARDAGLTDAQISEMARQELKRREDMREAMG